MLEDLDILYNEIDQVNNKLPLKPVKEVNTRMAKVFKYKLDLKSTNVEVISQPTDNRVSQYQEAILDVELNNTFYLNNLYDGYSVMIYISGPNDPAVGNHTGGIANEVYENKFSYKFFFRPTIANKGRFTLHLNELIGRHLNIGNKNKCEFIFKVVGHNKTSGFYDELHQNMKDMKPLEISLYKTNLDYSSKVDNITNAFISINEIKDQLLKNEVL